ncbi:MAG: LptF/LptG family permease, partial [Epsilonproteobacteria bacterium]|nr:LptF/LptG family permease [Campylobacterota bacterium]
MAKVKGYLLSNFTKSFLTLFLPFFMVVSIIYVLKISNLSYKTNLDFKDFLTLFIFVLPYIFFATIPLTFLGAVINTLSKLSEENELIAIFALGYSPLKILFYFFGVGVLFSALLIIVTLFILPIADQKMRNFESKKIYEAKLRILPKKLSQSFGKHHIFIEENINGEFKNITMFTNQDKNYLQILFANSGSFEKENKRSYLNLNSGTLYRYKDENFQI